MKRPSNGSAKEEEEEETKEEEEKKKKLQKREKTWTRRLHSMQGFPTSPALPKMYFYCGGADSL